MNQQALRWIEAAVGHGATVQSVSPLVGATSSAVYAVDVSGKMGVIPLVLRLFDSAEWLREEPDLARREAWGLRTAGKARVLTPELVAFDETGKEAGLPAVLMTRLLGRVELQPENPEQWLRGMASALVTVHSVEADDAPWDYRSYVDIPSLVPPSWSSENWERAIALVNSPPPPVPTQLIHRDFHPNNVLWRAGRVSGIVDWPNACRGAAAMDVAWCRVNLAQLKGVAAANRFLAAYETAAGSAFAYHPF